ncbi:MAG TPA: Txe/YoeB family addiction module toxin [Longimicrobium sp.]|jgi:toxin YoeB|uniref:Txe/YoeB family addiction module toxin n=1 Tax=Longimicrobium sp. TaxID=2029185 RepID=UPI002ED8ECD6
MNHGPGSALKPNRRSPAAPDPPPRRQSVIADEFLSDLEFWIRNDPRTAIKLITMMMHILRDPIHGIGKPEALRHGGGTWSRRLTHEHRILYRMEGDQVHFLKARSHYES